MPLKPGDKAPSISLLDQHGNKTKLTDFKGRKVLVYFYPKADTPGCTQQSCGLRDIAGDVGDTVIIGISPDKPAKLEKFDTKYSLGSPPLAPHTPDKLESLATKSPLGSPRLAAEAHAVAEAYEVWTEKSMYGRKY